MKIIKTLKEYQEIVDEVRKTKQPVKIKSELSDEDIDRGATELNLEGLEVIITADYDEIKILE